MAAKLARRVRRIANYSSLPFTCETNSFSEINKTFLSLSFKFIESKKEGDISYISSNSFPGGSVPRIEAAFPFAK
jgi:hypothetical protein